MQSWIKEEYAKIKDEAETLGRYIHANPEIAFSEHMSATACKELLIKHGFLIVEAVGGLETAFRATFSKGEESGIKKRISYLAEYDALPELGHACGHNLIAMCSVAAAIIASKKLDRDDVEISVIGTPAEEGKGGKVIMDNNGVFDNVDFAIMAHPSNKNIITRSGRATKRLYISFHGKEGHSSDSTKGVNALNAMIQLFNGINSIRNLFPINSNVDGIITEGGKAANIIVGLSSGEFSIRSMTYSDVCAIEKMIENVIRSVEMLTGAKAEYHFSQGYYQRITNSVMEHRFMDYMMEQGEEYEVCNSIGKRGSSDLGNIARKIPSTHMYFKITNAAGHTKELAECANSENGYEMAGKAICAMANLGYDLVIDKSFANAVKEQFEKDREKFYS